LIGESVVGTLSRSPQNGVLPRGSFLCTQPLRSGSCLSDQAVSVFKGVDCPEKGDGLFARAEAMV